MDPGSTPPSAYEYRPLNSENYEIRILTIEENDDEDMISCSLSHVAIFESEPYFALSYCWGDSNDEFSILLDHVEYKVGRNLHDALHALREKRYLRVWADAICINQNDREERSQQVRSMRQIYASAQNVISWLGKPNHRDPLDHLDYLSRGSEASNPRVELYHHSLIASLALQPYWARAWIVQEVTVASEIRLLLGNFELDWKIFAMNFEHHTSPAHFSDFKQAIPPAFFTEQPTQAIDIEARFSAVNSLIQFRERYQKSPKDIDLLHSIVQFQHTVSTEPRDRLYSLLGVSFDGSHIVPFPNYRQPLEEVLISAAKAMIRTNHSLDSICLKGIGSSNEPRQYPSWVPSFFDLKSANLTLQDQQFSVWSTKYHLNPISSFSDINTLRVTGVFHGGIVSLGPRMYRPGESLLILEPSAYNSYDQARPITLSRRRVYYLRSIFGAIYSTLSLQKQPNTGREGFDACDLLCHLWSPNGRGLIRNPALIHWLNEMEDFKLTTKGTATTGDMTIREAVAILRLYKEAPWNEGTLHKETPFYLQKIERCLSSSMRLVEVQTGVGRFTYAMCHPNSAEGDFLVSLRGCSVPLIIRGSRTENRYIVVGSAFVSRKQEQVQNSADYASGKTNWTEDGSLDELQDVDIYLV